MAGNHAKALDKTFFNDQVVHAKTLGAHPSGDFSRVTFPYQAKGVQELPSKKAHKKGKRHVKQRTQWTKMDD